jgi:hypothetical protein
MKVKKNVGWIRIWSDKQYYSYGRYTDMHLEIPD